MSAPLRDARGCLTDAGLDALERAPVGEGPPELVSHLSSCGRCQDRMLQRSTGEPPRGRKIEPPPAWRTWVVLVAAVLMVLTALITAFWLGGS